MCCFFFSFYFEAIEVFKLLSRLLLNIFLSREFVLLDKCCFTVESQQQQSVMQFWSGVSLLRFNSLECAATRLNVGLSAVHVVGFAAPFCDVITSGSRDLQRHRWIKFIRIFSLLLLLIAETI